MDFFSNYVAFSEYINFSFESCGYVPPSVKWIWTLEIWPFTRSWQKLIVFSLLNIFWRKEKRSLFKVKFTNPTFGINSSSSSSSRPSSLSSLPSNGDRYLSSKRIVTLKNIENFVITWRGLHVIYHFYSCWKSKSP